jgi:ADP-heptose:LPS heptosyltransferase
VAGCDLVVGNDTGTLHLAAACGVPTVTLFGPTDPRKWNPVTSTAVYLEGLACRPCYYLGSMPACPHFDCLRKLEPSRVAEAVRKRLAEEPAPKSVPGPGPSIGPRA